jgi:hypothetical protein
VVIVVLAVLLKLLPVLAVRVLVGQSGCDPALGYQQVARSLYAVRMLGNAVEVECSFLALALAAEEGLARFQLVQVLLLAERVVLFLFR